MNLNDERTTRRGGGGEGKSEGRRRTEKKNRQGQKNKEKEATRGPVGISQAEYLRKKRGHTLDEEAVYIATDETLVVVVHARNSHPSLPGMDTRRKSEMARTLCEGEMEADSDNTEVLTFF